jgi:ubiquinone/menaquinone biosynthesis C-methylase UbiE
MEKSEEIFLQRADKVILDLELVAFLEEKYRDSFHFDRLNNAEKLVANYFEDLELTPELLKNKKALDLGSGASFFDEYCREKYGTDFTALDISQDLLGNQHELAVAADAQQLPFKSDAFDLIISHNSMPHVVVPLEYLVEMDDFKKEETLNIFLNFFRESYRTLKKGGQVRMDTFSEKEIQEHFENRKKNNLLPIITENGKAWLERTVLIKEALNLFEKESSAMCLFKDEVGGGLIVIIKQ